MKFVPKYDIVFIVAAAIILIVLNEFFIEGGLTGATFILIFIGYLSGRYVEIKVSNTNE